MNHPGPFDDYDADKVQRVHLSHFLNHISSPCLETFPASFVEPCAYWSPLEKASFFQSLARHSRWKPDLIAEDIGGGKTIADVCSYIALLEQGSARESRKGCKRDAYPIAHELSEEWIAVENAVADELCGKEAEWQEAALKHKRAQELKEVKNCLRKGLEIVKGSGSGRDDVLTTSENNKRKHQASNPENDSWEERFKARKQELGDLWQREDMLSSLDERYLKTMCKMARTLESTETDKAIEGGGQLEIETICRDRGAQLKVFASPKSPHDVDAPSADQLSGLLSNTDDIYSQIDPLLLAIDRTASNPQSLSLHSSDKRYDPVESLSNGLRLALPLTSQAHAPESPRVEDSGRVFQPLRAQSVVLDPAPQTPLPSPIPLSEIPPDLTPASRRRLRKRLWTRRKRAEEKGIPVSEVPMDMIKLKPGRKAKPKTLGEAAKTEGDDSKTQVEVNHPGAPDAPSHRPPGQGLLHSRVWADSVDETKDEDEEWESVPKRKPYGWSKLMARQVSGSTLRADGMDLFHLEKFVSIMSLLGQAHALSNKANSIDELEGDSEGPSALSYPLLRLLRAYVVRFVTCLVGYVILHKDVETRQKRRIRGIFQTGGADEIRAENIREALLHMEKDTTTKQFFTRLKRTVRKASAAQAPSGKGIESKPRDTDDSDESDYESSIGKTEEDLPSHTRSLSVQSSRLFQKGFPPPCGGPRSASPLFWNPNILSALGGTEGDSLLPDKIDEAGLWNELRAEEKIEEADCVAAHVHECELWMEIGVKPVEKPDSVTKVGRKQTDILQKSQGTEASRHFNTEVHSLRFRQPGGAVKSRVYIDSDEDL